MNYKPKIGFAVLTGILILLSMEQTCLLPTAFANYSMLAPTNFTPRTFIEPKYDAFDEDVPPWRDGSVLASPRLGLHDYYRRPRLVALVDTPPQADFNIFTNQTGFQNPNTGTVETVFKFDASVSTDAETPANKLEVRWYFENGNIPDTYFSRAKSARHVFKKAGEHSIKLEALDKGGNISKAIKKVTIVENTPPIPFFKVEPVFGTENTVFHFDTSLSRDDQYLASYLEYRFDWDSDGKWDTTFQRKNHWYHRFNMAGNFTVTMEARDPGNQKAVFKKEVSVAVNIPPTAQFLVRSLPSKTSANYEFDASASFDAETPQRELFYRWDFHYNGPNDIVYDTFWSHSPKYFFHFEKSENFVVKLEVMDPDGAVASAIYRGHGL